MSSLKGNANILDRTLFEKPGTTKDQEYSFLQIFALGPKSWND